LKKNNNPLCNIGVSRDFSIFTSRAHAGNYARVHVLIESGAVFYWSSARVIVYQKHDVNATLFIWYQQPMFLTNIFIIYF